MRSNRAGMQFLNFILELGYPPASSSITGNESSLKKQSGTQ
jgi:hypothetical protein